MSAIIESTAAREPFTPGVRYDLDHKAYLSIEALSAHGIKRILQSPQHYRYDRDNPTEESTRALQRGTALHMGILEPERFAEDVTWIPDDAPKKPTAAQWNAAKPGPASVQAMAWWSQFNVETTGKLVLRRDDARNVAGMARAIRRHPVHERFFADGKPEVSFQWLDGRLQIPCRARFDYLREDGIAIDVKSCIDASPEGFARSCAKFNYHYQAAWYNNAAEHVLGESLKAFIFVAVESEPPYGVGVYVLQDNAIQFGASQCERAMLLYAQSLQSGYWRAYSDKVQLLTLPRWATTLQTPDLTR